MAFLHLLKRIESDGGAPLGTLNEEIVRIDALLAEQRSGAYSIEAAVERFARERRAANPAGYADEYKRIALDNVDAFVVPVPGARALFGELRELHVPYALLTNGWSPLQQRKAACIGFDGPVIASADIGVQKPDADAFEALAQTLGCPRESIAYVGDNAEADIGGAIHAGLCGVWFDAENAAYPTDAPKPSAVIHSLHQVLALVRP
ncbi:MAG: HAD family hydrolase [Candidatus Eremiobacteraeota bacterium]|nr:HAD family hydrolase [Candidatus Eremiobacteraeota bacterium]